jgi:hypothetical protein
VDWLEQIVEKLGPAPPSVVGVQGRTLLPVGVFSRQVVALLDGLRTDTAGLVSRRIVGCWG